MLRASTRRSEQHADGLPADFSGLGLHHQVRTLKTDSLPTGRSHIVQTVYPRVSTGWRLPVCSLGFCVLHRRIQLHLGCSRQQLSLEDSKVRLYFYYCFNYYYVLIISVREMLDLI